MIPLEFQNTKIFLQKVTFDQRLLLIFMENKLLKHFWKMNRRKEIKKNLELKKIIKKKGYKLYVKWKCYDNSFNSWIDKKDIVQRSEFFLESKSSN